MKTPNKRLRPEKICPVCQRPFQWRRKWRANWADVIYCSRRCRCSRSNIAKHQS
ncbi:DUF2256 domain-containing protein [Thalassotalea ponticola]|uniref:DUF2256 domain-containing protein n=1 Tax=Thalassotalea ponticola TaxID=1523392 RepID=UPI0025B2F03B|nr:DUF2256 domain-containing protein [Thalassotalea ponticola]MDN3651465.1 DUF2256 domain-containing protein [Thalassotalea ponticola]